MARPNTVLRSIETPDGGRCVDLFSRPDGSFGFEEYRRDIEDGRGWFPVARHSRLSFPDLSAAREAARKAVPWLKEILDQERQPF